MAGEVFLDEQRRNGWIRLSSLSGTGYERVRSGMERRVAGQPRQDAALGWLPRQGEGKRRREEGSQRNALENNLTIQWCLALNWCPIGPPAPEYYIPLLGAFSPLAAAPLAAASAREYAGMPFWRVHPSLGSSTVSEYSL